MANENTNTTTITQENVKEAVEVLNRIYMQGPYGKMDQVYANAFRGLNHRKAPTALPKNREQTPLIFMTRPRLNLSDDNLRADRKFNSLAMGGEESLARAVRCLLDPRLSMRGEARSPFVDNQQAFIPIFMECATSVSGWQDIAAQTFTAADGKMQETFGWVDGPVDIYRAFDIDLSLRNIEGNAAIFILAMWIYYQSYVFSGALVPYPQYILARRRDFDTRVYSVVLKSDGVTVSQVLCCGAAHPVSVSSAGAHNFEFGKTLNDSNDVVTARFRAYGQWHFDDIVIDQFNKAVEYANSDMQDGYRQLAMVKVPQDELFIYNHQGYPRINIDNAELEWYIPRANYKEINDYIGPAKTRIVPSNVKAMQGTAEEQKWSNS